MSEWVGGEILEYVAYIGAHIILFYFYSVVDNDNEWLMFFLDGMIDSNVHMAHKKASTSSVRQVA